MNYEFLEKCAAGGPRATGKEWLDSVFARLLDNVKENSLIPNLCDEVFEVFYIVMVDHTGKLELDSTSWHKNLQRNSKSIKRNLHILRPELRPMLAYGYKTFSSALICSTSGYCRSSEPVGCKSLQNKAKVQCKRTEDHIIKSWFPLIVHWLTSEKAVERIEKNKLDSFYASPTTLMSIQLKALLERSVRKFVSMFHSDNKSCLPNFNMALTFENEKMDLNSYIYPQNVQTIQAWLAENPDVFVDAKLSDVFLQWAKFTITTAVRENLAEPEKHLHTFVEKYTMLVDGTAQARIQTLTEEEHSFDEYTTVKYVLLIPTCICYFFSVNYLILTLGFFFLKAFKRYVKEVRKVQKVLTDVEETIDSINEDEEYFQWELTTYPEVEVIKESSSPYTKLFIFAQKWQTNHTNWMNDPFLSLDGTVIKANLEEFLREVFKLQKFFQQKSKEKDRELAEGEDPSPLESPALNMCMTVMEQMHDFQVFELKN
uniref:Uncharacterized protein n=1 Tax=Gouania willdenowi TaxID=441366 RepID=A0A8C5DF05_GOUWI